MGKLGDLAKHCHMIPIREVSEISDPRDRVKCAEPRVMSAEVPAVWRKPRMPAPGNKELAENLGMAETDAI